MNKKYKNKYRDMLYIPFILICECWAYCVNKICSYQETGRDHTIRNTIRNAVYIQNVLDNHGNFNYEVVEKQRRRLDCLWHMLKKRGKPGDFALAMKIKNTGRI